MAEKVQVNADKLKVLNAVMEKIEKDFGKGSIMRMNSQEVNDVPVIPTGSITLDMALGVGGYPKGRVVEIYGPESSGKTTLAIHAIAEAQKAGGIAAFIDAEHAFDSFYAQKLGVDVDNLLISQPDNGEQALEIADSVERDRHHRHRLGGGADPQGRDRRRDGRLKDGPPGPPDVAGTAQADVEHLEDQDGLHLHQPAARQDRCRLR